MKSDSHLESLMTRLSENLTALQSTYSEFTSTYNSSFDRKPKICFEVTEKQEDIQKFITNLKESLIPNIEILHNAKNSLIKTKLKLNEFPRSSALDSISAQLTEASKHLLSLEHSHIATIDTRLDELQEMITDKKNSEQAYLKELESQVFKRYSQVGSPKNMMLSRPPLETCSSCERIKEEYEILTKKISVLMQKVIKQVKVFQDNGEKINQTLSLSQIRSNSITDRKYSIPLYYEHNKNNEKLNRNFDISFGFDEITKWKEKAEKNEKVLRQQEENIEKLMKFILDENESKKKIFENFNKLKEQLEKKINDRDDDIKRLEEENLSQIERSKTKLSKMAGLEKENRELQKEVVRLMEDYEELDFKYSKKKDPEKKINISAILNIKDEEINYLKNDITRKNLKIIEKDKEIEDIRSCLKIAQINLEENKVNLAGLILEYDSTEKPKTSSLSSLEIRVQDSEQLNEDLKAKLNEKDLILQKLQKTLAERENYLKSLESSLESSDYSSLKLKNGYLLSQVSFYETLLTNLKTPCSSIGLKVLTRQKSTPSLPRFEHKSIEVLKRLLEIDSIEPSLVTAIGLELYEEDPNRFLDCISELKKDRDSYLAVVEKYADIINELKEALGEENEYNLLLCVDELKRKAINNNSF